MSSAFSQNWKEALKDGSFRAQSFLTILMNLILILFISRYFDFIQTRPGVYLHDPLLQRIPPQDLSVYTFTILYSSILIFLFVAISNPRLIIRGFQMYFVLMILRIIAMYFLPLEPSQQMIPLNDPFVVNFIYQKKMISKDLFFSGHVATMFLLFLNAPGWKYKLYFLAVTITVAVLILIQHVHYTIDVLAAPVFALASFYIIRQAYSPEDR